MSKFFNETLKANQLAQKQSGTQDLDLYQVLNHLKNAPVDAIHIPEAPPALYKSVSIKKSQGSPLVLGPEESSQAALEAYRGLRTRLMRAQAKSNLRSIAITSSLPNEGKTLTAMNLGLCYSQLADQRVLLVDADLRTSGLTGHLDISQPPGLAEVLGGQAIAHEVVLETDHKNLFVLPSGSCTTPPPELFTGPLWQELLTWCHDNFRVVLIDTPPTLPLADFELISAACDGILMVVRAHYGQREVRQRAASMLDQKKLLGVVFNATDAGAETHAGYRYGYR